MLTLSCTPEPRLAVGGEADGALEKALVTVWSQGEEEGLVWLATAGLNAPLEPPLAWLRLWARRFFGRLCQTRDAAVVEVPGEAERLEFLAGVPPMLGAEYLTETLLAHLWEAMRTHIAAEAGEDLDKWLHERSALWHLVGRVTFHLAENKRNAERPFAFLATFTEKVSASGQLQHLPLGKALQMYAGQKDQAALNALLEPVRAAAERSALVKNLFESRQLFQALAWTPVEAYRLVRDLALLQECGIVMKVPDWWKGGKPARATVQVTLDTAKGTTLGAGAMLAFSVSMSMGGEPLTEEEIAKIKASASGLVTLRGQWVEIDREQLDQVLVHWTKVQQAHAGGGLTFHEGMRFLSGFGGQGPATSLAGFDDANTASWAEVVAGKGLAEVLKQMRDPGSVKPPGGLRAVLRPYQEQGLAWLLFMQRLGIGACLADDMGLGKTVQVIALILALKEEAQATSLIVAPASLLGNWRAEFGKFSPSLRIFIAHASGASREDLAALESDPACALRGVDAVITTYQVITRSEAMQKHGWNLLVLDEAQAIKNPGSGQTRAAKKLHARVRVALTGTPVENRSGDLWSLFDFLNPGLLGSAAVFAETLKRLSTPAGTNFAPLRRLVQPYILRRMKTDRRIISDLPDKTEVKARCPLTRKQATIYTRLVEELKRTLADETLEPMQRNGQVLGFLMKFKQVCNHPSHWSGDGQYKPEDSGKFMRLTDICAELAERQERALVFTQFAEMCDPLAQHLAQVFGRPGLVLHGGTPVTQRAKLVEQFQAPGGPPFFVLSVKAGGTGLTLTAASHVVHFDRWWNPAVENQATDRAFRIGQKKNVLVHKFVVPGTIEERVDRLLDEKQALANDLLGGEAGTEKMLTEMSNEELLRFVALDVAAVE